MLKNQERTISLREANLRVQLLRARALKEVRSELDEYTRDRRLGKVIAYDECLEILKRIEDRENG